MDFDTSVKLQVFKSLVETTQAPDAAQVAAVLDVSLAEVTAAFQKLASQKLLILEPGDPSRIRMAPPFAGIETPFVAQVTGKAYYANCAWDAFGIAAALGQDADIHQPCPDCGQMIDVQVRDGRPVPQDLVIHFAIPAAHWWDDIIKT